MDIIKTAFAIICLSGDRKNARFFKRRYEMGKLFYLTFLIKEAAYFLIGRWSRKQSTFYDSLIQEGNAFYSQKKEELIIRSFFKDRRDGFFLDVGCAWPLKNNNTYFLEKCLGWRGIAVDANPNHENLWKAKRPKTKRYSYIITKHHSTIEKFYRAGALGSLQKERPFLKKVIKGKEIMVPTITISKLLDDQGVKTLDFVSIDIEESELLALAGFDIERFHPKLVCIERPLIQQPQLKKEMFTFFETHNYRWLSRYEHIDQSNWYFTPKENN